MKVDVSRSAFSEAGNARREFNRTELKHCRYLLRRLRFLEAQIREKGGMADGDTGGGAFAEWESEALEWILTDLGFLDVDESKRTA